MRKQIDGLSIIVSSDMDKNLCKGGVFLFFNKHLNKIKIYIGTKMGLPFIIKDWKKKNLKSQEIKNLLLIMNNYVGY